MISQRIIDRRPVSRIRQVLRIARRKKDGICYMDGFCNRCSIRPGPTGKIIAGTGGLISGGRRIDVKRHLRNLIVRLIG